MNVLVINCGSSSLKYQLIDSDSEEVLAKGICERIGIDGRLVYQKEGLDKEITEAPMPISAGLCSFVVSHCSTNIVTNNAVIAKSIPAVLKVIALPRREPIAVPMIQ